MTNKTIRFEAFEDVDIRVGRIVEVEDFERARVPTYKLKVYLGSEIGIKQSSAQFKSDYTKDQLLDSQCLAVVNLAPRNIAGFISEVLVVGVPKEDGGLSLVRPVDQARLGGKLY
jgi:tRNA-binding protein